MTARLQSSEKFFDPLEPIIAKLKLSNNSRQIVVFTETASPLDFDVVARDSQNRAVVATRYGFKTPGEVRASSATRTTNLMPGEAMEFEIAFNRLVDLSQNDVYQIRFRRAVGVYQKGNYAKRQSRFIESNAVKVKIVGSEISSVVGRKVKTSE